MALGRVPTGTTDFGRNQEAALLQVLQQAGDRKVGIAGVSWPGGWVARPASSIGVVNRHESHALP
jgi:hypothetical protein